MKAQLVIPRPPLALRGAPLLNSRTVYRFPLRWTDHHPASHYGIGVLLDPKGEVFDGFMFRYLRDALGSWIETDDPPRIAGCLGVPWQDDWKESGIGTPPKQGPAPRDIDAGHTPQ